MSFWKFIFGGYDNSKESTPPAQKNMKEDNRHLKAEKKVDVSERVLSLARQRIEPFPIELLEQLDDINVVDSDGISLLSYLCYNHSVQTVKRAIEKGANIHHRSNNGVFPLFTAVTSRSIEKVKALIAAGVDVNRNTNNTGVTSLHQAVYQTTLLNPDMPSPQVSREIALLLLDHGADPNTTDEEGATPLGEVENSFANKDGELKRRLLAVTANDD
jgi:ankyrin repeat protein